MGGPSVYSKIPDEVLQGASVPDAAWGQSTPADQVRRSVYVFVKRSIGDPVLVDFDAADKDAQLPGAFRDNRSDASTDDAQRRVLQRAGGCAGRAICSGKSAPIPRGR